jgi:hypothetical protein
MIKKAVSEEQGTRRRYKTVIVFAVICFAGLALIAVVLLLKSCGKSDENYRYITSENVKAKGQQPVVYKSVDSLNGSNIAELIGRTEYGGLYNWLPFMLIAFGLLFVISIFFRIKGELYR